MKALDTIVDVPQNTVAKGVQQAVVALEMGPADEAVLDYLGFLSSRLQLRAAHFLHVLPAVDLYHALYEQELRSMISNYTLEDELRSKMRETVSHCLDASAETEISVEVAEGDPLRALLGSAEERSADLIVIGQQAGTSHHGILARNLARQARCDAMVVPSRSHGRLRRLMVPVDFSEPAGRALQHALALREQVDENPDILAVHVFDVPRLNLHQLAMPRHQLRDLIARDREASFQAFIARWAPGQESSVRVLLQERNGADTGRHLMRVAEEENADLMLLGAKGHTGVELLLLGSVAERILELNLDIPTLVVR